MKNLSGKKLLFIGGGQEQAGTIRWAVNLGIRPFVIDIHGKALAFKYAEASLCCDIREKERILAFAKKHRVDGVTSLCLESTMSTVGYLVEELGVAGLNKEITENFTNKYKMRTKVCSLLWKVSKVRVKARS